MAQLLKQSTAVNITVLMVDSSDHVTGKTGLTLTIYATKAAGTPAVITPTVTELDSTNVKGLYKLALTSGHTDTLGELQLHVTSTGADPTDAAHQVVLDLPGIAQTGDNYARLGAPAGASVSADVAAVKADSAAIKTKTDSLTFTSAGKVDANTLAVGGTVQTARDLGASVLLSSGTGTGQLDFTSGVVKSNLAQILGTALTETAGQIAAAFKKLFNVATPTLQADNVGVLVVDQALSGHTTAGTVGAALNAAGSAGDPWATLLPGAYGAGTAGKLVGDNINAPVGSVPTADGNAVALLDKALSGHTTAGTVGKALSDAAAGGDPWDVTLPGAYASGKAGNILGNNIDAAVSAVKAKTDNLPAAPAAVSDIPTANANADALLDRANGVETGYTFRQAFRLVLSSVAGKLSGAAGTTVTVRNVPDTKSRITATVDSSGNRSAVTYDVT